jgi:hypothetical protein
MQYAYEFTLDKAQIPSADTYVPVYIPLPAEICAACLVPAGREILDLVVSLADGTALPRAVVGHDVTTNPNHTNVGLLVRVPVVDPISGAPKLYFQYRGSSIGGLVSTFIKSVYDNIFGGTLHGQMAGFATPSSATLADCSINFESFAASGTPSLVSEGPLGNAVRIDGTSHLIYPAIAAMRGGNGTSIFPRTIIGIAKPTNLATHFVYLSKGALSDTIEYLAAVGSNAAINFLWHAEFDGSTSNNRQRRSANGYSDTSSYHIDIFTADGGDIRTTGRTYRDGVRVDTTSSTTGTFVAPDGDNSGAVIGNYVGTRSVGNIAAVIHIDGALSENQALYQYRMFSQFLAGTIGAYGELIPFLKTVPVEDGFRHGFGIGIGIGF